MKILIAHNGVADGSTLYRLQMPLEHLAINYGVECFMQPNVERMPIDFFEKFDIVYFNRKLANFLRQEDIILVAQKIKLAGCKIVLDIDDYWHLSKDHQQKENYAKYNVPNVVIQSIIEADLVTTTNEVLAKKISAHNPNVVVLPNALCPEMHQYFKPNPTKSNKIRFGWFGSEAHEEDLLLMKGSFERLHYDNNLKDKFEIYHGGWEVTPTRQRFDQIFTAQGAAFANSYKKIPYADIYNYQAGYNQVDVILAPLNSNEFNRCKSELKMIEAGFMGKAAIVSDVHPYTNLITTDNCLKVDHHSINGWYKAIKRIINQPDLIPKLATQLTQDVQRYHLDRVNELRHKALMETLKLW